MRHEETAKLVNEPESITAEMSVHECINKPAPLIS